MAVVDAGAVAVADVGRGGGARRRRRRAAVHAWGDRTHALPVPVLRQGIPTPVVFEET